MMRNGSRNVYSKKLKLLRAFISAKSVDKMLQSMKELERWFDESDLGFACWIIGKQLLSEGHSPEQVLSFGNRALRIFIHNDTNNIPCFGIFFSRILVIVGEHAAQCFRYHNSSLYIAEVCNLLAAACFELKRFNETLSYLNWARRNFSMLLDEKYDDSSCGRNCVLLGLVSTHRLLVKLNMHMSRWEEVVVHVRKVLEISENIMEENCMVIGKICASVSDAYLMILGNEEALPFCLRALEIYTTHMGLNSVEVAGCRRDLAYIYGKLGEFVKALEQNQLSQDIFKNTTPDSLDVLSGDGNTGYILTGLGRYEEAVPILEGVVSRTDATGNVRGFAFVSMAKALFYLGKRAKAMKHMRTAQRIFEKEEMLSILAALGFEEMSKVYEEMNDLGKAITVLRRALNIPGIPLKLLAQGSATLFSLISLSGKEEEGIAYMEDVVEILKKKFGEEHSEVGYGYKNLGAAYLKIGQEESAVKFMMKAKNILNVSLGPHHLDSLKTSQSLAETYVTVKSFDLAIEIQEEVVKGLIGLGPSEQEKLDEAVSLLEKMELATRV